MSSSLPTPQLRVATSMLVFGLGLCILFITFGTWLVWSQHQALTKYLPVIARVLSVDVITVPGDKDQTTQRPLVRYTYQVAGVSYTSDRVTPLSESRSGGWAWEVANRYRSENLVTAYYNPSRPGDAYLDHTASLLPWLFVALPLVFLGALLILARSVVQSGRTVVSPPAPVASPITAA